MAPSEDNSSRCVVCNSTGPLKRCARCHITPYCTTTCQKSDWKSHKPHCNPTTMGSSPKWYDKHRLCQDEFKHEGRLELITWSVPATSQRSDGDDWCEDMGWGNCVAGEDSDSLKRKFETEFSGSEEKLYEYWPQGFRWTCCGIDGDQEWGCDHHGTGSESCTCDFCRVGDQTFQVLCDHGWLTVRFADGQSHSEQRLQPSHQLPGRQGAESLEGARSKILPRAFIHQLDRDNAGNVMFAQQRLDGMSNSCNASRSYQPISLVHYFQEGFQNRQAQHSLNVTVPSYHAIT